MGKRSILTVMLESDAFCSGVLPMKNIGNRVSQVKNLRSTENDRRFFTSYNTLLEGSTVSSVSSAGYFGELL